MFAALCGVSSGADSWVSVTDWAELQIDWLRQHLPYANGIASHDTRATAASRRASASWPTT